MSTYKQIELTDPSYKWLHQYLIDHRTENVNTKGFPHKDIGVNFEELYGVKARCFAQGPYIVHTIIVRGPDLLSGVTYTKLGKQIRCQGLRKDQLPELLPEMFTN